MRKQLSFIFLLFFCGSMLLSCGPKPYYKTAQGKKKWKKYNSIQHDRRDSDAPKGKKPKKKKPDGKLLEL